MQIYLARDNVQAGPYTLEQLNAMLASDEVLLTDLMWHSGMENWQAVGERTGGRKYYQVTTMNQPMADIDTNAVNHSDNPSVDNNSVDNKSVDNKNSTPSQTNDDTPKRRLTVAELYGRPSNDQSSIDEQDPSNHAAPISNAQTPNIERGLPEWQGRHSTPIQPHLFAKEVVFASIGKRLLAFAINMVLLMLAMMPLQLAILKTGIDPNQINAKTMAEYQALGEQIAGSISPTMVFATVFMIIGLAIVQLLLLAKRGQSLGKLVVGIRIVDDKTFKLASAGKVVAIRTLVLFVVYQLTLTIFGALTLVLLGANYALAKGNPKHQGWHDKLSKTVVVKANPAQLQK